MHRRKSLHLLPPHSSSTGNLTDPPENSCGRTKQKMLRICTVLLVSVVVGHYAQHTHDNRFAFFGAGQSNQRLNVANQGNSSHFNDVLRNIMVPRVVGTPSHQKVKQYIVKEMQGLGWQVKLDSFNAKTPKFGTLRFENIIAQLNPSAKQFVVLSCHYDSKHFQNIEFLGATDSAVPCAMLINLAYSLKRELASLKTSDIGLEIWFFDGEEAFVQWSPHDSLYGSRHLASKMEKENTLSKIKLLVLLDLIGTPGPYFYNYFSASENAYRMLVASEKHLGNHLRAVGTRNGFAGRRNAYFHEMSAPHFVEDDHTPFLERGVPILHMIPSQFPHVWHTEQDNWNAIDMPTIEDLNKILRMFVLSYFDL